MKTIETTRATETFVQHSLLSGEFSLLGAGVAFDYAAALISTLGGRVHRVPGPIDPHPAITWAQSGAMALTGFAGGAPLLAPGPLASGADGALRALRALGKPTLPDELSGSTLLGEHAAIFGLERQGRTSAGGSSRLLRTRDGWIALNLAREDDRSLLPAWLGEGDTSDPWRFIGERVADRLTDELIERARLLGLPAAAAQAPPERTPPWFRITATGTKRVRSPAAPPRVIDLTSLWAGPLCTHLLAAAGARVIKVESTRRPDGARAGPAAFFDLMNAGKESVALDFRDEGERERLRKLLASADIIVEASRPRALAQLGIDAGQMVREIPGLTWLSITGYGRREPEANWVAFGDDAGVAAGLALSTGGEQAPVFCADAIADPLTGIHAALAALASWQSGKANLLDLSLCDVASHALSFPARDPARGVEVRPVGSGWEVSVEEQSAVVAPPRARKPSGHARPLGADTQRVLEEISAR